MAIRIRENRESKWDGRGNPNFKPVPQENQHYIVRICTDELRQLGLWKGVFPNSDIIMDHMRKIGWFDFYMRRDGRIVVAVLSTRPRPKRVISYTIWDDHT